MKMNFVQEQAPQRFIDDLERRDEQQPGLYEGRETFHFSMAVQMIGVGRLIRDAHRNIGDHRGDEVEHRMHHLGKNAEAAGGNGEEGLEGQEYHGRAD